MCLRCTSGRVRVSCGAVGLVDVVCGAGAPFELSHGSVAGSYVGGVLGAVVATVPDGQNDFGEQSFSECPWKSFGAS